MIHEDISIVYCEMCKYKLKDEIYKIVNEMIFCLDCLDKYMGEEYEQDT